MKRLNSSSDALGEEKGMMYGRGFQSILEAGLDEEEFGEEDLCPQGEAMAGAAAGGGEKKRRLRVEQVKALEKNFEVENKLEPERKVKLAQELGLQPRQVAVWFQNRRARWKTKQLERDYGLLKSDYDALRLNYDSLHHDKEALLAEIKDLRAKLAGEESYCSVKEEPMASESENNNKPAAMAAAAEEEEEEPLALIYKDGTSDSDSSAILNDVNSPHDHLGISSSSPPILLSQPQQPNHQVMPLGFEYCSSSSSPFQISDGRVKGAWHYQQQQLMRVDQEHNFLSGEEPCSSFFSDDQAPSLAWYCSDQWN